MVNKITGSTLANHYICIDEILLIPYLVVWVGLFPSFNPDLV
ncbi:hypothetical protein CORMATOL_00340 [Corynebacterium matruchotii ATCC 33806]|uniref:Uncharacterized protein n=1 Tax=Corynebacterium matruchotii ATCC 33806 TaxID=566549 RepID=C0E041_9CORY|nr:hypothetical protein CORMATOL_00340 [Corynebacterium matruchotii ATCC 33806]